MTERNKNYKKSQKGRSMVEMLGVLAIVGVLSVGGVYGYGVAMKKHKANELLHQASMLATTISAQAMTNNGTLPQIITSFGNSSYGNFPTSVTDALDGKGFSITIENVDSGACTQLEKMAGGMVRDVTCDEATGDATITYYKNLATNDEEGKNSPTGENGGKIDTCANGNVYLSYMEDPCATETPMNQTTTNCVCTSSDGKCMSYEYDSDWLYVCPDPAAATLCTSNKDCAKTEYCSITGYDGIPEMGTCMPLGNGVSYAYKGKTFLRSDNRVTTWWAAENWCKAKGMKLVSLATLGIDKNNLGTYFDNNSYCYKEEPYSCESVNWDDLDVFSDINVYFWTGDYDASYRVYYLGVGSGTMGATTSYQGIGAPGYALCKE